MSAKSWVGGLNRAETGTRPLVLGVCCLRGSWLPSSALSPVLVSGCQPLSCPKCSRESGPAFPRCLCCPVLQLTVSFGLRRVHIRPPGLLPEPPGAGGVSSPQTQRRKCGHLPKAKAGRGYQRREADAGAKTTDVCFETRLFRCNLSPKNNRREHTHDAPAGLWGDGGSGLICGFHQGGRPEAWLGIASARCPASACPPQQEGRRAGKEREGPQKGHISLCT